MRQRQIVRKRVFGLSSSSNTLWFSANHDRLFFCNLSVVFPFVLLLSKGSGESSRGAGVTCHGGKRQAPWWAQAARE